MVALNTDTIVNQVSQFRQSSPFYFGSLHPVTVEQISSYHFLVRRVLKMRR